MSMLLRTSNRIGLAQGGDLLCAVAELLEHRASVLAELGRRRVQLAGRARQREGLADQRELALLHRLRHADMLDLRVGEHLVDRIDRSARHARLVEPVDPLGAAALDGVPVDLGIERVAVLRAAGAGRIVGIGDHVGRFDRLAEAFPDLLPGRRDVDMAVGGLEHSGRDAGRVIVARLLGDLALDQIARRLEVEHEDLGLQQRCLDVLALARLLALQERGENTHRAGQSGRQVGDRDADPHRPLAGQAGDRHQPAHALGDLVEARPRRIGAALAEARDAAIDDARIDLAQILVVDAEPLLHVRPEILHHHVVLLDQPPEHREPLGRLQVQRDAALVAVQVLEIRPLARAARRLAALELRRRLDLDHVGAPVGELTHAGRPRANPGEVEDGKTRKGLRGPGNRHIGRLPRGIFRTAPAPGRFPVGYRFALKKTSGARDIPRYRHSCPARSGPQKGFRSDAEIVMMTALATAAVLRPIDETTMTKELASTGKLRVGVVAAPAMSAFFVTRDAAGQPRGVTVEFLVAPNSGEVTDALCAGAIDVTFMPVDAERKQRVEFGPPYFMVESTYLVPARSGIGTLADVDRPGVRVVGIANTTTIRSAARSLKNTTIVAACSVDEAMAMLRAGQSDAFALSHDSLPPLAAGLPGSRILAGGFQQTVIAIAVPKNRPQALAAVTAFMADAKASGLVRRALDGAGFKDATVAP